MNIRAKIKEALREQYGDFNTDLETEYITILTEKLIIGDIDDKRAWLTYNQVILELKNSIRDILKVKELQYKLTDNLDPNKVCIEVIEDVKDDSTELKRLYLKISNY